MRFDHWWRGNLNAVVLKERVKERNWRLIDESLTAQVKRGLPLFFGSAMQECPCWLSGEGK